MLLIERGFVEWASQRGRMTKGHFFQALEAFKAGAEWQRDQNAINSANAFLGYYGRPTDPPTTEEELGI